MDRNPPPSAAGEEGEVSWTDCHDGLHDCIESPCVECPMRLCDFGCGQTVEDCACEPDYEEESPEEHDCGEDTCVCLEPGS